ncbi:MAG: hypothetical protein MJ094_01890 [Saccharofermentans sp.]|nr:hypothetical protein [Saccharofermentans sp.]
MAKGEFNINSKSRDEVAKRRAVYIICGLILVISTLLNIYFLTGIFAV